MNTSLHKTKTLLPVLSLIIGCVGMLLLISSCNTQTIVELDQKGEGGKITVNVSFASFFTEYLRDLIGFRVFSDVIDLNELKTYFEEKQGITNVFISVSNKPESIVVHMEADNLVAFFEDMEVFYEGVTTEDNFQVVRLGVTQDFVKDLITQLPAFADMGEDALFLFNTDGITKKQFTQYIAWSLSDYENTDIIQTTVDDSSVSVIIQKHREGSKIPDEGWELLENNTQKKSLSFTDLMYEDEYNLSYTQ